MKENLRARVGEFSPEEWLKESRERELMYFYRTNRYCGECGATTVRGDGHELLCTGCGQEIWPKISPAIVVLVMRGDKALLVHSRNFRGAMHALVAGFVEPGETLEQCVCREVMEETGLTIKNLQYRGSQSWPFPSQLMVGYTAEWADGEIEFRDGELSSGGWFDRTQLPELPLSGSLSRMLIDSWIEGK